MSKQTLGRAAPGTSRRVTKGEAVPLTEEKWLGEGDFLLVLLQATGVVWGFIFYIFPQMQGDIAVINREFQEHFPNLTLHLSVVG